jgi:hypothetical protein
MAMRANTDFQRPVYLFPITSRESSVVGEQ